MHLDLRFRRLLGAEYVGGQNPAKLEEHERVRHEDAQGDRHVLISDTGPSHRDRYQAQNQLNHPDTVFVITIVRLLLVALGQIVQLRYVLVVPHVVVARASETVDLLLEIGLVPFQFDHLLLQLRNTLRQLFVAFDDEAQCFVLLRVRRHGGVLISHSGY